MLHPDLEARPSPIHGTGLFARRRLPAGTALWTFGPGTTRPYDAARDPFAQAFEDPQGRLWVCLDDARFWNHSCAPNAAPLGERDVALCDLEAGEELTYDYGLILPSAHPPFPCRCGRPACRGSIGRLSPDDPVVRELRRRAEACRGRTRPDDP